MATLSDYPRPNVAVDLAVFTVADSQLCVLSQPSGHGRALPGRFIRERQTVEQTIAEVLRLKLNLQPPPLQPELIRVFSAPDRDERGWTMSIAYSVTMKVAALDDVDGTLVPLEPGGGLPARHHLLYDHDLIVTEAADNLRRAYGEDTPDPGGLLQPPYTLSDLRELHEAVLGEALVRDTFNRRMKPSLAALTTGDLPVTRRHVGRPAQLFERAEGPGQTFRFG